MSCLHVGSFAPGLGRPLGRPVARPVAWSKMAQNRRWSPAVARIVARTYLSLPIHLYNFTSDRPATRPRPLSDGVRQAGLGRILPVVDFDRAVVPEWV